MAIKNRPPAPTDERLNSSGDTLEPALQSGYIVSLSNLKIKSGYFYAKNEVIHCTAKNAKRKFLKHQHFVRGAGKTKHLFRTQANVQTVWDLFTN